MSGNVEVIQLLSVVLSREKQLVIENEFETYAKAVNYAIREIYRRRLPTANKTEAALAEDFGKRFDSRPGYLYDVVKTARAEIGKHRRLAKMIRSLRGKKPVFESGTLIFSHPIISVNSNAVLLQTRSKKEMPIPFDKRSRNDEREMLQAIERGKTKFHRVRLRWNKEGFLSVDVRAKTL